MTTEVLEPSDFEPLLGACLGVPDAGIELTVESVTRLTPHALRAAPFALVLRLPRGWQGQQGLYTLEHPQRGRIELFCTPIEPRDDCARLEAVFN
jgi:hypothetical protein